MAGFKEIIQSEKPVLIDFHAEWCGPCKSLAPIIKQVKSDLGDRVKVIKIDIDKNQLLASKLNVKGVPTLMIYQSGELKWRESGVIPAHLLKQQLEQFTVK